MLGRFLCNFDALAGYEKTMENYKKMNDFCYFVVLGTAGWAILGDVLGDVASMFAYVAPFLG